MTNILQFTLQLLRPSLRVGAGCAIAATLFSVLTACQHYRIDEAAQRPARIHVDPIINHSLAPQLAGALGMELRETLARDPRFRPVNSPDQASRILTVTLVDFSEKFSAAQPDDTGRAASIRQHFGTRIDLYDTRRNRYLLRDHPVEAPMYIYAEEGGSLQNPRLQSGPAVAADLSGRIRDSILAVYRTSPRVSNAVPPRP